MTVKIVDQRVEPKLITFSDLKSYSAFMLKTDLGENRGYRIKLNSRYTEYNSFSIFSDGSCNLIKFSDDTLVTPIELEITRTK